MAGTRNLAHHLRAGGPRDRRPLVFVSLLVAAVLMMGAGEPGADGAPGPNDCPPGHKLLNVDGSLECVNQSKPEPAPSAAEEAAQQGQETDTIEDFLIPQLVLASGLMLAGLLLIGMGLLGRAFREVALNSRANGSEAYDDDHVWLDRVARLQVTFGIAASSGGLIHGVLSWLNAAGS